MHFTDLFLYVPIPKNHIDASVISLYFFNRQAGVASSIKRNFNKIDIFYSTFNRKYICVKETKTLKIKTTLKKTKKKKKNRANPLRLTRLLYQPASRKCLKYSLLHFRPTEYKDIHYHGIFLIKF